MLPHSHSTIDHEKIAPWTTEQDITPSVHEDETVSLVPLIFFHFSTPDGEGKRTLAQNLGQDQHFAFNSSCYPRDHLHRLCTPRTHRIVESCPVLMVYPRRILVNLRLPYVPPCQVLSTMKDYSAPSSFPWHYPPFLSSVLCHP